MRHCINADNGRGGDEKRDIIKNVGGRGLGPGEEKRNPPCESLGESAPALQWDGRGMLERSGGEKREEEVYSSSALMAR